MPVNSVSRPLPPQLQYIQGKTNGADRNFIVSPNRIIYELCKTNNSSGTEFHLQPVNDKDIEKMNITFFNKVISCDPDIIKNPNLVKTILGQYTTSSSFPNRFRAIADLNSTEKSQYKQISNIEHSKALRCDLLSLIDEDLKGPFELILREWETFGVSASEVDMQTYTQFKEFYDEVMEKHSTKKPDYTKLDFATQNIKSLATDPRCCDAKLTVLQIFKAAFQMGGIPALSNLRFMDNLATKEDGKYREWMFHVDNSNYASEYKQITTRIMGTCQANKEQCLAAFPYDTSKFIRFTQSESATKFPTFEELKKEFSDVPGASYVVIHNSTNDIPLETGIRTELIAHHRSASNKEGLDHGESRSSELLTFHEIDRCVPFLSREELKHADNLTPLQNFILGGFKNAAPEEFMKLLATERQALNSEVRKLIKHNRVKSLESITVAKFAPNETTVINNPLFNKQLKTYNDLPEILDGIPRLTQWSDSWQEKVLKMVPMLMNYDQNAKLKPDYSENKTFPARTQLRERTNAAFCTPLSRDLEQIQPSNTPDFPLPMDKLTEIARNIKNFYSTHTSKLEADHPKKNLFESRAALAEDYDDQLTVGATHPETHQTLTLFMYYMIDDLDEACQMLADIGIQIDNTLVSAITAEKIPLLKHIITHRMLNDSYSDEKN